MATLAERQAARLAELDAIEQMRLAHAAERAEKQKEQDEFMARVQARRDAVDSYIRRSWAQRSNDALSEAQLNALRAEIQQEAFAQVRTTIPTMGEIFEAKRAEEQAAKEAAEQARIAALTPREIWLTTLSWAERQHVLKYEQINNMPWPYAPV